MAISKDRNKFMSAPTSGFILYCQTTGKVLCYNTSARDILSLSTSPKKGKKKTAYNDINSICIRWKEILNKRLNTAPGGCEKENSEDTIIDTIHSLKRRYVVRGNVLYGNSFPLDQKGMNWILFTLERTQSDILNLSKIFRQRKLNRREQEIVQLLISDHSNKEIARALSLSINTVKCYTKLLMRKLNVSSRSGVIGNLFVNAKEY
jgi:DNA-binding CsgD family transcriptional regulator